MKAKGPGQSAIVLLSVVDILNKLRIPYAIIGAFAASFYGVIRASLDADAMISLAFGQAKLNDLMAQLRKAGLKSTFRKGDPGDPIGAVISAEDGFGNRVDLLMNIRGMTEASFSRAVKSKFMKKPIRLVGIEDFIAMKIFAGSPKDLSDVMGALEVSSDRVDEKLLRDLVRNYGKAALQELESLLKGVKERQRWHRSSGS